MYLQMIWKWFKEFREWRARRASIRHLRQFDDHLLRDIGIERSDIERYVNEGMTAMEAWRTQRFACRRDALARQGLAAERPSPRSQAGRAAA